MSLWDRVLGRTPPAENAAPHPEPPDDITAERMAEISVEVEEAFEKKWGGTPDPNHGGRTPWPTSVEAMAVEAFKQRVKDESPWQ